MTVSKSDLSGDALARFRQRLVNKELLVGTFQKTPSMMISEVIALTNVQAVCIDAEHSPFDRSDIDACVFAYRAANVPSLVRIQNSSPEQILNVLDCGATGVIVPHVDSAEKARQIALSSRYGAEGRGYAGSSRAARYATRTVQKNIDDSANNVVIAQIEDVAALSEIDEIVSVEGIDCFFIGIMDLTVSLGCASSKDQKVLAAAEKICQAAVKADKTIGMFVADIADVPFWREKGVSLFLLGSEHGFIKQGLNDLVANTISSTV